MSCNCGCGGCQTKTQGPLLTEGKVKSLLSEGLQYHIDKQIPLFETVYRIGSDKHLALIKEARKLYSRNIIDLCEEDEGLIKTHLGEFGMYEGESVPLDLPMVAEFSMPTEAAVKAAILKIFGTAEKGAQKILDIVKREGKQTIYAIKEIAEWVSKGEKPNAAEQKKIIEQLKDIAFMGILLKLGIPTAFAILYMVIKESGIAGDFLKLNEEQLDEKKKAKKKKKDPPLGKPKRGGSKAYYVYVRDPKTKRIKKVSFGSGGLRAKIRNSKARNAFAKRHRCKEKNDRTKPSYWSCRLPRYASALGLGANMNTFW